MKIPNIVPIASQSNVEAVARQLEQLIGDGFWKVDERIPSETELGQLFHVGRSSVREAVKMLKAKGLVYSLPGLGTYVSVPEDTALALNYVLDPASEADLLNIMEIRLSLEPMNAYFAAERATDEELADLRLHHDAHVAAFEREGDLGMLVDMDIAFHALVAAATHNPVSSDIMKLVHNFMTRQQNMTAPDTRRRKEAIILHERILQAICDRRPRQSRECMREHMEATYEHVRSIIEKSKRISARLAKRS